MLPDINDNTVQIDGYNLYRNDVVSTHAKHGVCFYIRASIRVRDTYRLLPNALGVYLPNYNVNFFVVYRPGSNSPEQNTDLLDLIEHYCGTNETVFMGDFNLPSINWDSTDQTRFSSHIDREFYTKLTSLGLSQWVHESTFLYSDNILDLVLTTDEDRVINLHLLPPLPRCGHSPVIFDYLFQFLASRGDVPSTSIAQAPVQLWSRADFGSIRRHLAGVDWGFEFLGRSVDECYDYLLEQLSDLVEIFVPVAPWRRRRSWKPRIPPSSRRETSRLWSAYKTARFTYGRHSPEAANLLALFKACLDSTRSNVYTQRVSYEEHLGAISTKEPKKFHKYIRERKHARPSVGPLLIDGTLSDDPILMSETLVRAFTSVFDPSYPPDTLPHQVSDGVISTVPFSEAAVRRLLSNLRSDGGPGPDGLKPLLLKNCAAEMAIPLTILFTKSLEEGILPRQFKLARVSPIYKGKGSRSEPLNYCPISLTSVCCKTMERLVAQALFEYFELHNILTTAQFGFRPGRSTLDQLLLVYNKVTSWFDASQTVDVILFDFLKAFDRVNHRLLIKKLAQLGVSGFLLEWIHHFLTGRRMCVSVGGCASSWTDVESGVPQGSVLGPLLFLVFVNHLVAGLDCKFMLFADDLKIYLANDRPSTSSLQKDIDWLSGLSRDWGLVFNTGKTVCVRFHRGRVYGPVNAYRLDDSPVNFVDSCRDLGVVVDSQLRFHQHIGQVVAKAGGVSMNLLKSTACRSPEFMCSIFKAHIRPILEYASPVWNTGFVEDLTRLEAVQRRWTKRIDGLSELSYAGRLEYLNLFSVRGRLWRADMIQCWRIFHGQSPIAPEDIFVFSVPSFTRGHCFKIASQHSTVEARRRFFSLRVTESWNKLPEKVVLAQSVSTFKNLLLSYRREKHFEFLD